jgi:hypothetical protein
MESAMSDYTVSIPSDLCEKVQRLAEQTSQPVDERFLDLPGDEQAELKAIAYLSDDALWTIAREQMPKALQERMSALMTRNTRGTITDAEHIELTELVERGNKLTLRKAQAMNYLMDRGYTVRLDDLKRLMNNLS